MNNHTGSMIGEIIDRLGSIFARAVLFLREVLLKCLN